MENLTADISIHAPRTGSDFLDSIIYAIHYYFNPRSPHGERHEYYITYGRTWEISIHAPRTGSDADELLQVALHV